MQKSIYFFLNGQEYVIKSKVTLFELIEYFNYHHSLFVLEHNTLVCNKKHWQNTYVQNNDRIEIVTIVGGG